MLGIRDVEPPEQRSGSSWQPPTTPEQVLGNMEQAVLERNVDNYLRCLSDSTRGNRSFRFLPDEETQSNYPGVFSDWSLEEEKRVFRGMENSVPGDSLFQLVFADQSQQVELFGDSARIEIRYTLRVHHTREDVAQQASGLSRFSLSRNAQRNWVIHRWDDIREGEGITWSTLKAVSW